MKTRYGFKSIRASKNRELQIKEALHIQMTPDNNKFKRDMSLERPGCWLSMLNANHPSVTVSVPSSYLAA